MSTAPARKIDWSSMWKKEDWWALWIGLFWFIVALAAWSAGTHLKVIFPTAAPWVDISKAWSPSWAHLVALWIILMLVLLPGAYLMKIPVKDYIIGFTIIFWVTELCWTAGHWAVIAAANPLADCQKLAGQLGYDKALCKKYVHDIVVGKCDKLAGVSPGLGSFCHIWYDYKYVKFTGEFGYILCLIVGLILGNIFKELPGPLKAGARPEWYIKTAIVLLGAVVGWKLVRAIGAAWEFFVHTFIAIFVAYLIYWPLAFCISRYAVRLDREFSAVLASGVGVCGVSAAIAACGAIRANPMYATITASIIVLFAVVELLVLPFAAVYWYPGIAYPLAAGAWMGLAVKTDGAAAASAAVIEALMSAELAKKGVSAEEIWVLGPIAAGVNTKIMIDIWIGLMAFILACIWVYKIERKPGERVSPLEIWFRFPKFVIGYFGTMFIIMAIPAMLGWPYGTESYKKIAPAIKAGTEIFRKTFFALTFTSIGIVTRFAEFKKFGLHKAVVAYAISLFIIIFIGLGVAVWWFGPLDAKWHIPKLKEAGVI